MPRVGDRRGSMGVRLGLFYCRWVRRGPGPTIRGPGVTMGASCDRSPCCLHLYKGICTGEGCRYAWLGLGYTCLSMASLFTYLSVWILLSIYIFLHAPTTVYSSYVGSGSKSSILGMLQLKISCRNMSQRLGKRLFFTIFTSGGRVIKLSLEWVLFNETHLPMNLLHLSPHRYTWTRHIHCGAPCRGVIFYTNRTLFPALRYTAELQLFLRAVLFLVRIKGKLAKRPRCVTSRLPVGPASRADLLALIPLWWRARAAGFRGN